MADDWDIHEGITAGAPSPAATSADNEWDTHEGISAPPTAPPTSAYEAAGGRSTWGDVGQALLAGGHQTVATFGGMEAALRHDSDAVNYWQGVAQSQQQQAQASEQAMTPAAQAPGFFNHPLVSTAEALPPMAAVMGPAMVSGPLAPAVGATLMAGQGVGDTYNEMMNAALAKGMSPEQADAAIKASGAIPASAALSAATGLFPEVAGPLAGKIATSSIARGVLLGTGDTVTFGASGMAGEYGTQRAEQKEGFRTNLDVNQIVEAGRQQALMGAGFGGLHLLGSGQHRDLTQTGGAATVARENPAARTDQAKPRASTALPDNVEATKPAPPSSPVDDPAVGTALTGKPVDVNKAQPDVTPRVKQPEVVSQQPDVVQSKPVEQPPVAQLEPTPLKTATEAPPAPDTTQPVRTPQPPPEGQPAARPAPAIGSLEARHAELVDRSNPREAMEYPAGVQVFDIPDKTFGQVKLHDGRVIQFDRQGPNDLTVNRVRNLAKTGKLAEILGESPDKGKPTAPAVAGAPPAAAPEQPPVETAMAAPDAAATPEAQPGPEPVEQSQVASVQPKVVEDQAREAAAAQQVTPGVTGRVLRAEETPEEKTALGEAARQQIQTVQKNLKALAEAGKEKERGVKHRTKAELIKQANDRVAADKLVADHPAGPYSDINGTYKRAEAMVKAANDAGITIPKDFREGHPHNASLLKLREAADLIKKKNPSKSEFARFMMREHMIDNGQEDEAFAARRAEGAEAGALGSPDEIEEVKPGEHVETEMSPLEHILREEEEGGEPHYDEWEPSPAIPSEDILRKIEAAKAIASDPNVGEAERANAMRGVGRLQAALTERQSRERAPAVTEAVEGEHYTVPKAVTGFQTTTVKRRTFKRQEMPEGEGHSILTADEDGNPVEIKPVRSTTAREAIGEHYNPKNYAAEFRPMMERLRDAVMRIAGDVQVHYISHADMQKIGGNAYGLYDTHDNVIYLNNDHLSHDTALHETFHAATSAAVNKDPHLKDLMTRLWQEVRASDELDAMPSAMQRLIKYPLSSPEEFLTGMMTEPAVQQLLRRVKISDELAHDIGIPKWRKATMWEGAMSIIRQALKLGPRDTGAIEAAMAITEHAFWKRDPMMAMQAAGRLARAEDRPMQRRLRSMITDPDPEQLPEERGVGGKIKDFVNDVAPRVVKDAAFDAERWFAKQRTNFMSDTQIAGLHRDKLADSKGSILDKIIDAKENRWHQFNELSKGDNEFLSRTALLMKKYAPNMADYGRLLDMSGKFGIHADQQPKPPKNLVTASMDRWQANKNHQDAYNLYASLPEELRDHYKELKTFYKDKATAIGREHIERVLREFEAPDYATREQMVDKALKHDLSDEDMEHYNSLDPAIGNELRKAYGLMNPKGVYFNAFRDGDYVVTGRYDMPAGGNSVDYSGSKLPDDTREFDSRADAHEYATSTDLHATPKMKYYFKDPNDPSKYVTEIYDPDTEKMVRASSDEYDAKTYQVTLQREHTEIHQKPSEAERARKAMEKIGVKDVSQVLDKRRDADVTKMTGTMEQAFAKRIDDRSMTDGEKQTLKEASRQIALMLQSGNRIQKHWTQRRNVAGANYKEIYDAARSYSNAANYHIANSKSLSELDKAMGRLNDFADKNRTGENAGLISRIQNAMTQRAYGMSNVVSPKMPGWMRALQTAAFIKYLVTPRFIIQHQMHPLAFSVPQMSGRHGYMNAFGAQRQALSDVGGNIPNIAKGLRASGAMVKALFDRHASIDKMIAAGKPLDMLGQIIEGVRNAGVNGGREALALEQLRDAGRLHSGFDDEFYGASKLDKLNMLTRQTTNAMEATNRASTGLAAYRLERAKLLSEGVKMDEAHDRAVQYAKQTIDNSMGVFTPSNMAPMFKHPMLRGMMQFKQFPIQQAYSLIRNAYHGLKDESPEVRKEAVKTLGYQLGGAAVMAGVHGLPLEILKAVGLLGSALGVSPSPSQIDDRMRRGLADSLSPTVANAIMDGPLSTLGPFAPDVSNIFGYNGDFFYGEPHNNDWKGYILDTLGGAPLNTLTDTYRGIGELATGDWAKAVSHLPVPGLLANFAKAYTLDTEGAKTQSGLQIMPASPEAAAMKILGFTSQQQNRAYEGRTALQADMQDTKAEKRAALTTAQKGDMSAVLKWNAANPQDRISLSQARAARKGQSAEAILGEKVTPRVKAKLDEYERTYQ